MLEDRLSFHAEPLGLVLIVVGDEAEQTSNLRIDPCQRVRKGDPAKHSNPATFADRKHAGVAIAFLIHRKDESAIKR